MPQDDIRCGWLIYTCRLPGIYATDGMLHTVLRRRAGGEAVEQVQPDLITTAGQRIRRR